ncbi:hypothetical protein L6R50_25205 [Myxococcota bacterium]|nr:hypothetical protein [Myxococcota bacterium]
MEPLEPWELANTVTGLGTCLAGALPLLWTWLMGPQPRRWVLAYALFLVTGIFTVTYHGLGETHGWRVLDTGSNIVVAWAVQAAALGDFRPGRARDAWTAASGVLNGVAILLMWRVPAWTRVEEGVALGAWGGFMLGEVVLIANAVAALALFAAHRHRIAPSARPLLALVAALFAVGAALSTAANDRIAFTLFPVHACWHLTSMAGLLTLWAFNHKRFAEARWAEEVPAQGRHPPAQARAAPR